MRKRRLPLTLITVVIGLCLTVIFVYQYNSFFTVLTEGLSSGLETGAILDIVSHFLDSFIIVLILLIAWLFLIHYIDGQTITKARAGITLEHQRYEVAMSRTHNVIWEYNIIEDTLSFDDPTNSLKCPIDISGSNRSRMTSENIIHPDDHLVFYHFCDQLVTQEPTISAEMRAKGEDGVYMWYEVTGTKIFDKDGYPISIIGQTANINDQKQAILELVEQAAQDPLTKLLSYTSFVERAQRRIATMDEPTILALMLIDIDDFTSINDSYGCVFADAILIDIANRFKKLFNEQCLLGRYGADEFVVLLDYVPSISYVEELAENVINTFHGVYIRNNDSHYLSGSIGISIFPVDDNLYEGLFIKADTALYNAKCNGKGRYSFYNSEMVSVPEAVSRRKYRKQSINISHFEEHSTIDSGIIAQAIDILSGSKEIDVSINTMLSLIGSHYNLDQIFIIQYIDDGQTAIVSNEWASSNLYRKHYRAIPFSLTYSPVLSAYRKFDSGAYICNDIKTLNGTQPSNDAMLKADIRGLFQYGIKYQDEYIGAINMCTCESEREWTLRDTDSLTLLSKIIGSYIIHKYSEKKIDDVVQRDALTNTYNFNTFLDIVNNAVAASQDANFFIIYSDVYQFKLVNDNFGYQVGDYILTRISEILKDDHEDAVVSRITGDKFVAFYQYENEDEIIEKVKGITYATKHIHQLDEHDENSYYKLAVMIGIYPMAAGDKAIVAVDRANIARKNVQDYHVCNYMLYNDSMHHVLLEQKEIEDSMDEALHNEEFYVYYQPKIDMSTKKITGSEALVRWKSSTLGFMQPGRFIPLFEENGFIVALDYYVLEHVCSTLESWSKKGLPIYPVSVNFSRLHFNSNTLPSVIKSCLERHSVPPELLEIEITESALGASDFYQKGILNEIHEIGCRLSMDDFGSGMSSLNVLRDLPFDILKIDKDFFHSKATTPRERIVISNIVRMALDLNMDIVCEGVETEEQEQFLRGIGCSVAQGYLYAAPMPEDDFVRKYLEGELN